MKKYLKAILILCLVLLCTPVMAAASQTGNMQVMMGTTTLSNGYYVPAKDTGTGTPANIRVVDKVSSIPADGNYLEYKNGVLTIHGKVVINSNGPTALNVKNTSEMLATFSLVGDASSSLEIHNQAGQVFSSSNVMIKTADGFGGYIKLSSSSAPIFSGSHYNITTTGNINISSGSIIAASDSLTLKGNSIQLTATGSTMMSVTEFVDIAVTGSGNLEINTTGGIVAYDSSVRISVAQGNLIMTDNGIQTWQALLAAPEVILSVGGDIKLAGNSYIAVSGALTIEKAKNVEISSAYTTPVITNTANITASGTVTLSNTGGGVVVGTSLQINDASAVSIKGASEKSLIIGTLTLNNCSQGEIVNEGTGSAVSGLKVTGTNTGNIKVTNNNADATTVSGVTEITSDVISSTIPALVEITNTAGGRAVPEESVAWVKIPTQKNVLKLNGQWSDIPLVRITQQPQDVTMIQGENKSLSITAVPEEAGQTVTYEWYQVVNKGADKLLGNESVLPLSMLQPGNYIMYCMAHCNGDSVKSIDVSVVCAADTEAPVIGGIEDKKIYCEAQTFTVTDMNLAFVTVNGTAVTEYTLAAGGTYKVVAADKIGNTSEIQVTINNGHTGKHELNVTTIIETCQYCDKHRASVTVNEPDGEPTYNGENHPASLNYTGTLLNGNNLIITYIKDGQTVSDTKEAGYYKAEITLGGKTASAGYVVNKMRIQDPVIASKTYNGAEQKADVPASEFYTVARNNGGIHVKEYEVWLTLNDTVNHEWKNGYGNKTRILKFAIIPDTNVWTQELAINSWNYGSPNEPSAAAKYGIVKYSYYTFDGSTYTELTAKPTDAGTYYVKATVAADGNNYAQLDSDYVKFEIQPKALEGSVSVSGEAEVGAILQASYSGAETVIWQWYRNGELISGAIQETYEPTVDDVGKTLTASVTGTGNYSSQKMSEPTEKVTYYHEVKLPDNQEGYTLTADKDRVDWNDPDGVTLQLALQSGYSKIDTFAVKVNGQAVELVNDVYVITDTNVTSDIIVTVEGVADITAPVISGIENNKTYCKAQSFTVTEEYLDCVKVNGQTVTDYILAAGDTYEIIACDKSGNQTVIQVTVNDGHTGQYAVSNPMITETCQYCNEHSASVSISVPEGVQIYNGETHDASLSYTGVLLDGNNLTITYTKDGEAVSDTKAAGQYRAEVTLGGESIFAEYTVEKAEVADPAIDSKVYNGETQAADVTASNLYTVTGNDGGVNVGEYDVVLTLTDDGNYKWTNGDGSASRTLKFIITADTNEWTKNLSISGWIYGSPNEPSAEAKYGIVNYTYYTFDGAVYTELTAKPTDIGTYYVKATVAADGDNYIQIESDYVAFQIETKALEGSVSVSGEAEVGVLLQASYSSATETVTWQWYRDGEVISGAIQETYELTVDDIGKRLTVSVTGTGNYSGQKTSEPTAKVTYYHEVKLPDNQEGYTMTADKNRVDWNDPDGVTLQFALQSGYSKTDAFAVKVNGQAVELVNGTYMITDTNVTSDITVTVEGVADITAPVISGIEDNKTYCQAQIFTVTEENLDYVTVNGVSAAIYFLAAGDTYEIIACDKSGNQTVIQVTVNDGHTAKHTAKGATIFENCRYCDKHGASVTIKAPEGVQIYNGKRHDASLNYIGTLLDGNDLTITYVKDGEAVSDTKSAGKYRAEVTLGKETVFVEYQVISEQTTEPETSTDEAQPEVPGTTVAPTEPTVTPTEPTESETTPAPTEPETTQKEEVSVPSTGDTNNILMWVILLAVSVVILAAMALIIRTKRSTDN